MKYEKKLSSDVLYISVRQYCYPVGWLCNINKRAKGITDKASCALPSHNSNNLGFPHTQWGVSKVGHMTSSGQTPYMTGLKHGLIHKLWYSARSWNFLLTGTLHQTEVHMEFPQQLTTQCLSLYCQQSFISESAACPPRWGCTYNFSFARWLQHYLHSGFTNPVFLTWHYWILKQCHTGFLLKSDCPWFLNHTVLIPLLIL